MNFYDLAQETISKHDDWIEGEKRRLWSEGRLTAYLQRSGGYIHLRLACDLDDVSPPFTVGYLDKKTWYPDLLSGRKLYEQWSAQVKPVLAARQKKRGGPPALWVREPGEAKQKPAGDRYTPLPDEIAKFLRRLDMAIKGLTDRQGAFPQIAVLRKGGAKESEKKPGQDLTFFRFDCDDEAVTAAFAAVYGSEPREINVFLPYPTAEENFFTAKEEWRAGGLVHRCDGEMTMVRQNKDGTYNTDPAPCPGGCKPVGRLKVVIPELKRLAYVVALTTSLHDIMTLQENLVAAEMIAGDLRGIPFILRRSPREVSTPADGGKRVRREKWLLSIEPAPAWVAAQLTAMQQAALPAGTAMLESPEADEDPEDDNIIDQAPFPDPQLPSPKPQQNGKRKPPASPEELLALLNRTSGVIGYYHEVSDLPRSLARVLGQFDGWPEPGDVEKWREYYQVLRDHALVPRGDA